MHRIIESVKDQHDAALKAQIVTEKKIQFTKLYPTRSEAFKAMNEKEFAKFSACANADQCGWIMYESCLTCPEFIGDHMRVR